MPYWNERLFFCFQHFRFCFQDPRQRILLSLHQCSTNFEAASFPFARPSSLFRWHLCLYPHPLPCCLRLSFASHAQKPLRHVSSFSLHMYSGHLPLPSISIFFWIVVPIQTFITGRVNPAGLHSRSMLVKTLHSIFGIDSWQFRHLLRVQTLCVLQCRKHHSLRPLQTGVHSNDESNFCFGCHMAFAPMLCVPSVIPPSKVAIPTKGLLGRQTLEPNQYTQTKKLLKVWCAQGETEA